MGIHPRLYGGPDIFCKGIGRHGDDRDPGRIRCLHGPDRPCGRIAVHFRHLDVHEDASIGTVGRCGDEVHRLFSVHGRLTDKSHLLQQEAGNLTVDLHIVDDQDPDARKALCQPLWTEDRALAGLSGRILLIHLLPLMSRCAEAQPHGKGRSTSRRSVDGDRASHEIQDLFGDRHSEPGPLDAADSRTALPLKGFKNMGRKAGIHANPVVPDPDPVIGCVPSLCRLRVRLYSIRRGSGLLLFERDRDLSAFRRKFTGIADQVEHDPHQPRLIKKDIAVLKIDRLNRVFDPLLFHLQLEQLMHLVQDHQQVAGRLMQLHFAALDPAHLQNIIDQIQQVAAGVFDLIQVGPHGRRILFVFCQSGESDDRVHGRPDIVRHIGKKSGFCFTGRPGCLQSLLQGEIFTNTFDDIDQEPDGQQYKNTAAKKNTADHDIGLSEKADPDISDQEEHQQDKGRIQDRPAGRQKTGDRPILQKAAVSINIVDHDQTAAGNHAICEKIHPGSSFSCRSTGC